MKCFEIFVIFVVGNLGLSLAVSFLPPNSVHTAHEVRAGIRPKIEVIKENTLVKTVSTYLVKFKCFCSWLKNDDDNRKGEKNPKLWKTPLKIQPQIRDHMTV